MPDACIDTRANDFLSLKGCFMVTVLCVRVFVDPREFGKLWTFKTLAEAESVLGWFFVHNNCDILKG